MPSIPAGSVNVLERLSPDAFAGPMVQFSIGDGHKFYVLKKVLVERSRLKWNDLEKKRNIHTLPNPFCKEHFSILVKWMYTDSVHFIKDENDAWTAMPAYIAAFVMGIWGACTAIQQRFETFYENNYLDNIMSMFFQVLPPFCGLFDLYVKILPKNVRHLVSTGERELASKCMEGFLVISGGQNVKPIYAISGVLQLGNLMLGLGDEVHSELLVAIDEQIRAQEEGIKLECWDEDKERVLGPMQAVLDEFRTFKFDISPAKESDTEQN